MTRIKTHPGEILKEEFLIPFGVSARQLVLAIDIPANRLTEIIRGNRGITADTALRLPRIFGTTAEFWMNLQMGYDLSVTAKAEAQELKKIKTIAA
jgi:addiction module HigA family antidote